LQRNFTIISQNKLRKKNSVWRRAATKAGVPAAMIAYWEKEMTQQTQPLRDHAKATGRKN